MSKVTPKGDLFVVEGQIDEGLDYFAFDGAPRPLKLDFAKVKNVNSIGVREFLKFVRKEAPLGIEFHRCSPAVMDMINSIPASLGSPARPEIVKSMILTYRCTSCAKDENFVLEVKPGRGTSVPELPQLACSRCRVEMLATADPDDLFTYLIAAD